ncbi:hypothetical protein QK290_07315 [Pseudarthrobacter sp. AL07]|uniref:hypothetical protein n=1 Tax=unclassified Pseudarthrobacter TaxID=2647000 RepID=UPI00249C81CC|nr:MULTISPECIES: hypothetical protein [unclassified Pseudarthrobacter]MDI3194260.1 hypothetical protein [Pseudarthrobacter sp. AL20]MDI3208327.1 hypothetical protein [Pseudarthrobacter sp. AL07]
MASAPLHSVDPSDKAGGEGVDDVKAVKQLRSRVPRQPVDSDSEGGGREEQLHALAGSVPGVGALNGVRHVTPFLGFAQSYANVLYPSLKSEPRRLAKYAEEHRFLFGFFGLLDFVLQLCLIVAVLVGPAVVVYNGVKTTLGL